MKITRSIIAFAAIALICALSGCSSDKSEPLPDVKENLYSSSTLELYYNSDVVPGKWARLTPVDDASSKNQPSSLNARLSFGQTLDLGQVSGLGLSGEIQGPGPTPGDALLSLPVTLVASDGCYLLSGSGSTDYLTFSYSGKLSVDKLEFQFNDCTLKSQAYAGKVFAPAPITSSGPAKYSSLPFHLVWELDPAAGIDIPLSEILKIIATAPIVPVYNNTAYSSPAQLFDSCVKTIALTPSGNMPVMYISQVGGAAHPATTSPVMLQYIPTPSGIKLFMNPLSVFGQFLVAASNNKDGIGFDFDKLLSRASEASPAEDSSSSGAVNSELTKQLLEVMITSLAPQIKNGVPLTVTPSSSGVDIYLDTATSVQFLATLLQTAMKNPVIMQALQQYLASLGTSAIPGIEPTKLQAILQSLPTYLEKTTKLEIGLSLIPYSPNP